MNTNTAPRLLFLADENEFSYGEDVMSDLKLEELLPEGTAHLLRLRPSKNGVLQRRELFSALLRQGESVTVFTKLEELLSAASRSQECIEKAPCENGKAYVFPEFAARMLEFYREAALERDYGAMYESFRGYFKDAIESEPITELSARLESVRKAKEKLALLTVEIDGEKTRLSGSTERTFMSSVTECAEKLGIELDTRIRPRQTAQLALIDSAAKLFPHEFADILGFYREFRNVFPSAVFELIPQLRLVRGVIELTHRAENAGLPYCFPELTDKRELQLFEVYDPALLLNNTAHIVPNDVYFDQNEPFFYLTGANGGGKTTYLRAVGSAAVLFAFGAPVFCRAGHGCLFESIQTHFPRDERFEGTGRFMEEQGRVEEILKRVSRGNSPRISLILLNETYSTTNEEKATQYTSELARQLHGSGNFGLYITHQHSAQDRDVPFLGVTVDENDCNRRTYRIERRRLSSRSFAADVLLKYGITRDALSELMLKRISVSEPCNERNTDTPSAPRDER